MEEPVRSQARLDQTKRLSNAILRRTVVNVEMCIRDSSSSSRVPPASFRTIRM